MRGNGGRIGPKYNPSDEAASGVWSLAEVGDYQRQSRWPPLIPALYSFTTATFTPGGATYRIGPTLTQARSGITASSGTDWVNNTAYLNTTGTQGGIILWTVPRTGTYSIDAYGAQGGTAGVYGVAGGLGARIKGDFSLTKGQVLALVVGQQGRSDQGSNWGGGGGGGSFVWINGTTSAPLIAAGGGGSGGQGANTTAGGQTTTSGGAGVNGAAGGTGGYSGNASGICGGGNGSGWFGGTTQGCGGTTTWQPIYTDPTGAGGASAGQYSDGSSSYGVGGFGGGNGAYGGGGGGGGYSGGGSAGWAYSYYGGGGGSYNTGTNQTNTAATRSGSGQIIITKL